MSSQCLEIAMGYEPPFLQDGVGIGHIWSGINNYKSFFLVEPAIVIYHAVFGSRQYKTMWLSIVILTKSPCLSISISTFLFKSSVSVISLLLKFTSRVSVSLKYVVFMISNFKIPVKKCIMNSLAIFQHYDAQILVNFFNVSPPSFAAIGLCLFMFR
jgi:hypothetical protein